MRLLLASDSFPPLIGGGTRDTALLAASLNARGHEVTVVTVHQPGLREHEERDGVRVVRVTGAVSRLSRDPHRRHHPPVADPVTVHALRRLIHTITPDVVSTYGWISHPVAAAARGVSPVALTVRDSSAVCANRTLVERRADGPEPCSGPAWGKCVRCAHRYYGGAVRTAVSVGGVLGGRGTLAGRLAAVHWCSSYLQAAVRPHLRLRTDVLERVIPPFRSSEVRPAAGSALAALPAEPYILFVGQFRWEKGVSVLLDAWSRLPTRPPLVLIGSSGEDVPDPAPDGVTVIRDVDAAAVLSAWDRALFGVAPSVLPEGFGNVVHEGMSRGRAVIGTAPSGMQDIIDDEQNGLLVPRGDIEALRGAMLRLLDEPRLARELGAAARAKAEDFTEAAVVPQMEDLFAATAHRGPEISRRP